MDNTTGGFILGVLMGSFLTLMIILITETDYKSAYQRGQIDYEKGIIKYQDTLKSGDVHCYKIDNYKK